MQVASETSGVRKRAVGVLLAALTMLAACGNVPPGPEPMGAGPMAPIGGSAGGGMDPSWAVCQGGNPQANYNCTLN